YYKTKEIADLIGLTASSIRRYTIALDKAGYVIKKDDNSHRRYTIEDVKILEYLHKKVNNGVSFDDAVKDTVKNKATIITLGSKAEDEIINESTASQLKMIIERMNKMQQTIDELQTDNKRLIALVEKQAQLLDITLINAPKMQEDTNVIDAPKDEDKKQEDNDVTANSDSEITALNDDKDVQQDKEEQSEVNTIKDTPIKIMQVDDHIDEERKNTNIECMRKESEQSNDKGIGKLFSRLLGRK
uniref:helix-turn-helix domain-containing protein n=1 Tax=Macrococcoides caseolyticum TaxID=69966 RepID=UPI003F644B39